MRAAHASSSAGDAGSQTKMRRRLGVPAASAAAATPASTVTAAEVSTVAAAPEASPAAAAVSPS